MKMEFVSTTKAKKKSKPACLTMRFTHPGGRGRSDISVCLKLANLRGLELYNSLQQETEVPKKSKKKTHTTSFWVCNGGTHLYMCYVTSIPMCIICIAFTHDISLQLIWIYMNINIYISNIYCMYIYFLYQASSIDLEDMFSIMPYILPYESTCLTYFTHPNFSEFCPRCFRFLWAESALAATRFKDISNCSKELNKLGVKDGRNGGSGFFSTGGFTLLVRPVRGNVEVKTPSWWGIQNEKQNWQTWQSIQIWSVLGWREDKLCKYYKGGILPRKKTDFPKFRSLVYKMILEKEPKSGAFKSNLSGYGTRVGRINFVNTCGLGRPHSSATLPFIH